MSITLAKKRRRAWADAALQGPVTLTKDARDQPVEQAVAQSTSSSSNRSASASASRSVPDHDFRRYVGNMFLRNEMSSVKCQKIADLATAAGARGVADFQRAGASGKHPQNLKRDLLRLLLRDCDNPPPYYFACPVKVPGTEEETVADLCCLLPHEVLHGMFLRSHNQQAFFASADNAPHMIPLLQEWGFECKVDCSTVVPLGLHGDGVPFAAKMRDSLEQFSWNVITISSSSRILFTGIPKSYVAGRKT